MFLSFFNLPQGVCGIQMELPIHDIQFTFPTHPDHDLVGSVVAEFGEECNERWTLFSW